MEIVNFNAIILLSLLIGSFAISAMAKKWFGQIGILSGVEFVIIGAILGENFGFGILTSETLRAFLPFLSLLIGLFGFLFGLEIIKIKIKSETGQVGVYFHLSLLVISVVLFAILLSYFLPELSDAKVVVPFIPEKSVVGSMMASFGVNHVWLALTLGGMLIVSSYDFTQRKIVEGETEHRLTSKIQRLVSSGEVIGIFFFGAVFASAQSIELSETLGWSIAEWVLAVIGMGCFCGFLFFLFIGKDDSPVKTYLATLGVVILASGMALAMGISPLFLNFVCGATLALSSSSSEKIAGILNQFRGPLSIMMLFFAGTFLTTSIGSTSIIVAMIYIVSRYVLQFATVTIFKPWMVGRDFAPGLSRIFVFQDVLIIVFALDLAVRGHQLAQTVMVTSLLGYTFFAILGNGAFKDFLADSFDSEAKEGPTS